MRIGILTFHTTANFGATLQCYALFRHLSAAGHEVEVLNYAPPAVFEFYKKDLFRGPGHSWRNIGRVLRFYLFVKRRLRLSGPALPKSEDLRSLSGRHDLLVVGSDEVWKVEPPLRPLDPAFYLDFADPSRTRLVSYAASSSTRTDLREVADVARPLLARFHARSVRDRHTADMVAALGFERPAEVLDPTFLWDFSAESAQALVEGDYLALYGVLDRRQTKEIRALADKLGLRLVSVGARNRAADRSVLDIGPLEWMRVMRHARYIVTDYFHGAAFAMHFRVPFSVYANPWKRVKVASLLELGGLGHRLFPDVASLAASPEAVAPVDFAAVESRFAPLREASVAFLRAQVEAAGPRT